MGYDNTVIDELWTCDDTSEVQDTDLRNPSRYFMVFETGDNTTVEVEYRGGRIRELIVKPETRRKDVVVLLPDESGG